MTNTTPSTPMRRADDRPAAVPFLLPRLPLDAPLVALCAEFGSNERERRRLIASLPCQRGTLDALRAGAVMRGELARLTGARQGLIARIMDSKARTIDGIRVKAAVVRALVADLPAPGDARIGMADSLATDAVQVLA